MRTILLGAAIVALAATAAEAACITANADGVVKGVTGRSDCLKGTDGAADRFVVERGYIYDITAWGEHAKDVSDTIRRYRKADGDVVDVPGSQPRTWYVSPINGGADRILVWDVTGDGRPDGFAVLANFSGTTKSSVVLR